MKLFFLSSVLFPLAVSSAFGAPTYAPLSANFAEVSPVSGHTTTLSNSDGLWGERAGFSESGGPILEGWANNEDAVELTVKVTGLLVGQEYDVYVNYVRFGVGAGDADGTRGAVRAAFGGGDFVLFDGEALSGEFIGFAELTGFTQADRAGMRGLVGRVAADANGEINVRVDDDGVGGGIVERVWLSGVSYEVASGDAPMLPPAPVNPFDVVSDDGVWTFFNGERAVIHGGMYFVGGVKSNGQYSVNRYDPETKEKAEMIISTASSQQKDDHNNPSITVLGDGKLLIVYSRHSSDKRMFYRRSLVADPKLASDWGPEQVKTMLDFNAYANTYRLADEGKVYSFSRSTNRNPTVVISDDEGVSWGVPKHFIKTGTGGVRPYPRYCSDKKGRIDMVYTDGHPRAKENSVYHLFYEDGKVNSTGGTLLKTFANLPLEHDSGERGAVVYQYKAEAWGANDGADDWIPTGRAWVWDVQYQKDGKPACVFQVQKDNVTGTGWNHDRIYYYYARWTGTEWQRRFIAQGGRGAYSAEDDYGGGLCIDPVDPRVVYISSNAADPFALGDIDNVPLRANDRYEIWRGFTADGGLTFTWTAVTENSDEDNMRPTVVEGHERTQDVIWMRGQYSTYSNYEMKLVIKSGEKRKDFNDWKAEKNLEGDAEDDDDADGATNLLEFGLGSDPGDVASRGELGFVNGKVSFQTFPARSELEYRVMASGDLSLNSWETAAVIRGEGYPTVAMSGFGLVMGPTGVVELVPEGVVFGELRRFYRLVVELR